MGGHSSSLDSHLSFGVHQELFHGFHQPHFDHHDIHHDFHHDLHHDHHWSPWPVIGYGSYRYGYSSGYYDPYYDPYATPVVYSTPVVVTQPPVIYTDPTPIPDGYQPPAAEDSQEILPGEGTNVRPRDGHAAPGLPPVLRAPLTETGEAPEVLPPLPPGGPTEPQAAPPAPAVPTPR